MNDDGCDCAGLRLRLAWIAKLLGDGFDRRNMEYHTQWVNHAHRLADGGPLPECDISDEPETDSPFGEGDDGSAFC